MEISLILLLGKLAGVAKFSAQHLCIRTEFTLSLSWCDILLYLRTFLHYSHFLQCKKLLKCQRIGIGWIARRRSSISYSFSCLALNFGRKNCVQLHDKYLIFLRFKNQICWNKMDLISLIWCLFQFIVLEKTIY